MRSARVYSVIGCANIRPILMAAACLVAAAPSPALALCVIAMVNGEAITDYDVERRVKSYHTRPLREQVIENLIDDKLKVQAVRRYKPGLTENEAVQQADDWARRMHTTGGQLTEALRRGAKIEFIIDAGSACADPR